MKKITKSALLISVLISSGVAFSADTFKNSILDMSMKKELNNTVSLTIYTSKPYNENLFITKRDATTYVILFPETNTSLKKEISKAETAGLVQKVDVKTQPYNDQNGKGYTKVVLTTPENTTVLAKTEVYNPDAQPKKLAESPIKMQEKKIAEPALHPVIKEPEAKPPVKENAVQPQQQQAQKAAPKKEQEPQKFDIIKPENLPKSDVNNKPNTPAAVPKEEVKNEFVEPEVKQEEQAKINEDMPLQEADAQQLPPPPEKVKKAQKSELVLFFESKAFWGSAAGFVLLLMLVLFLNARKKMKEIIGEDGVDLDLEKVKQKTQPVQEPVNQNTGDDETESKVNLYRLLNSAEGGEEQEVEDTYSDDLANLLDVEDADVSVNKEEIAANTSDEDVVFDDIPAETHENSDVETEFVLDDIVIDESEEEKQEDELFELNTENMPAAEEIHTHENVIDDYMKYLADNPEKLEVRDMNVPDENAVVEDVSAENTEFETIPADEPEEEPEQEIALVDMSAEETQMVEDEQNRLQGIYEEVISPEPEVQETETISFEEPEQKPVPAEFEQTDVNSLFEREDFASDIMQTSDEEEIGIQSEISDYDETGDNEPIFGDENNVLDLTDYKQTVRVHQPAADAEDEDEVSDEAIVDYVDEHETAEAEDDSVVLENGLKVISQVQIKKNAGLYMVDYEGNHALIGFKNDNYYVLKNFDETPKKELQARLYDKTGRKEQYLVKLGHEKMIVEFNQKEIKHVMDL